MTDIRDCVGEREEKEKEKEREREREREKERERERGREKEREKRKREKEEGSNHSHPTTPHYSLVPCTLYSPLSPLTEDIDDIRIQLTALWRRIARLDVLRRRWITTHSQREVEKMMKPLWDTNHALQSQREARAVLRFLEPLERAHCRDEPNCEWGVKVRNDRDGI